MVSRSRKCSIIEVLMQVKASVGCSDDTKYDGSWSKDNYVVVVVFSAIGVLILIATIVDLASQVKKENRENDALPVNGKVDEKELKNKKKEKKSFLISILKCFSLPGNLQFILGPSGNNSQRLGCLEGELA